MLLFTSYFVEIEIWYSLLILCFGTKKVKKTDTFFTILREFVRSVSLSFIVSETVDVKAKANSDR